MRKVLLFMLVSLDGFFEGTDRDISWHNVDDEFNELAIRQLDEIDTLLFGRVTYEGMASFWPTPLALEDDPIVAGKMNAKQKLAFSRTLETVEWNNTRLVKEHIGEEILKLKGEEGGDIAIFGSSNLCVSLIQLGLIDEFRIMVNPVVLGSGTPLFHGLQERLNLKLTGTRTFNSGNVMLYYQPA